MIKFYLKAVIMFLVVLLIAFWGYPNVKEVILSFDYFDVKNIEISGVINGDGERLKKMYEKHLGENLFKFDVRAEKITKDKWIERVEVKRIWPSTVKIIVYENKGLFTYKNDSECFVYTFNSKKIQVKCSENDVNVFMRNAIDSSYLKNFAEIYKKGSLNNYKKIVLKESYFKIYKDSYEIKGSYSPDAFLKAYRLKDFLTERYSSLEYLDLRVPGKIYVKGVLNEAG
ncbi:MAG: FtsQ-type POTRA domain-containing protein [Flexistipes sinusarabici]|uniref:FtsQ-type POTRA domain-containing protein n=1 Tax=Flexistipes sinusarabici TaxID=2352 RepID=A0A5D0MPK9_FLESI|nr:FtsQ-type POTRA domain-containing protein [Flexistipes sinusarabici]TYB33975.1 MAG: FtsQ-type POTRA domain-containing protein [Flexistipes sinusarabici]